MDAKELPDGPVSSPEGRRCPDDGGLLTTAGRRQKRDGSLRYTCPTCGCHWLYGVRTGRWSGRYPTIPKPAV